MKFTHILFVAIAAFICTQCSKPENELSLLTPEFKRCHLSKEYINQSLYREVTYVDETDYRIDQVIYYDLNSGAEIPEWRETFFYGSNNKVERIETDVDVFSFSYNEKGDLSEYSYCVTNNNYCETYKFTYTNSNRPENYTYSTTNGFSQSVSLYYTDLSRMSYFGYINNNIDNTAIVDQKFQGYIVDPYFEIRPTPFNLFLSSIIEDYTNNEATYFLVDSSELIGKNYFPTEIERSVFGIPNFNLKNTAVFEYEYIGCE